MPRRTFSLPKYRKHKASGQAIVTLDGKDFYLGPHGTRASHLEYDRLVGEWQQNGRRLPDDGHHNALSMAVLLNEYRKFAKHYYVKNGRPTDTIYGIRAMLKLVRKAYGHTLAVEFGPIALKTLQNQMVDLGLSRRYINDQTQRIRRMFKWAASNEMVPFEAYQRLTTVRGLAKGRTPAREMPPILPVSDDIIDQTVQHLSPVVADMVRFQRLTGCRPEEVCMVRPGDIDMSGEVWQYKPRSHKTEHHDRVRIIMVGFQAQALIRPYLLRGDEDHCFSPIDSEKQRLAILHTARKTPLSCGNRPGSNRKPSPKRQPRSHYATDTYRRAIHRACDKAFPAPEGMDGEKLKQWKKDHRWSPNRIRHTTATEVRQKFGLEAAQAVLGHSSAEVTQIYAERDLMKAADVARQVG